MSTWTPEDIELSRSTRREFMRNRTEDVVVTYLDGVTVDPYTDVATGAPVTVTLAANIQIIKDEDNLLQLGGRVQVGDVKAIIHWEDVDGALTTEQLRGAELVRPNGSTYIVEVLEVKGLGAPNRVELGLVRGD